MLKEKTQQIAEKKASSGPEELANFKCSNGWLQAITIDTSDLDSLCDACCPVQVFAARTLLDKNAAPMVAGRQLRDELEFALVPH